MRIISYKYYSTMLISLGSDEQSLPVEIFTSLSDLVKKIPFIFEQNPIITNITVVDSITKELLVKIRR